MKSEDLSLAKLYPKKNLGQNFLVDRQVLARIARVVEIEATDRILEVGPGRGALTALLAQKGSQVMAVELDRDLVPFLRKEFAGQKNVEVVEADIMSVDLCRLLGQHGEEKWKVAANLPYNISSQVLFRFLENRRLFSLLVLMLQKEVGERLLAPPSCKEYGALTVLFRQHFDIRREFTVKPGSFYPVPKVDSVVLRFTPLLKPRVEVDDEDHFRRVVKAAFSHRRKTLWNCLRGAGLVEEDDQLRAALVRCGIDSGRRGETLTMEEFAALTVEIGPLVVGNSSSTGKIVV